MTEDDYQFLRSIENLFVGQLSETERERYHHLVKEGYAYRSYDGVGGFLGMPKVKISSRVIVRST